MPIFNLDPDGGLASAEQVARSRVLLVRPARSSGVGVNAAHVARELRRHGWPVSEVTIPEHSIPAIGGLRAMLANRQGLRHAAVVHLELGALDATTFWFGLLAAPLARIVVIAHDVPRIVVAPGAGLIGGGTRWRDVVGHRILAPLLDRALRQRLSRSSRVGVVLTEAARRDWAPTGPRRILVVDHGGGPPTATHVPPSAGRHVLYAGFLGPSKGIDVLLDAWGGIDASAGLPLVIAGTHTGGRADERYARQQRQRASTLVNPPIWRGWVSDQELAQLFSEAAIVVVPYRRSNPASGVIVRAMVEGRPIVATRVPAAVDALRDGEDGLLVDPGDAAALTKALAKLIQDPALRDLMGEAVAHQAANRFTWERHIAGLESAYRIACEDR